MSNKSKKVSALALLPIGIFVVLYLGLGILFEYVLKVEMGFYSIPIIFVFLISLFVAYIQTKGITDDEKMEVMGKGVGDPNIIAMLIIFVLAGAFVGVVGRSSAESVAYFILSLVPAQFSVAVIFIVACLVSLSMGTSVGTITLIMPIAVAISDASGFSLPLCAGAVVGGSMFGDNLSFISDTTIAACNGQGVKMKSKFRENFAIALPAAILALALFIIISLSQYTGGKVEADYNLVQIIPYLLVLVLGIVGLNVYAVLFVGIFSGIIIMLATGASAGVDILSNIGSGVSGMFETCMVAIFVSAICALVKHNGGFDVVLSAIRKTFKGNKAGQLGIGLLVGLIDIATANNTVAIVVANPIAKKISQEYDIRPEKTASILDTFSCIVQGFLPYGAQLLVCISACKTLEHSISAFQVIPFMFYPMLLLVSSLIFIFVIKKK